MIRNILAIVLGLAAGMVCVGSGIYVCSMVYPLPPNLDMTDHEQMSKYVAGLPTGALLIVLASHSSGALVGGVVCGLVAQRNFFVGGLTIGVFFLLGGIMNLASIAHPRWFAVVDLILYLPAGLVGVLIGAVLSASLFKKAPDGSGKDAG